MFIDGTIRHQISLQSIIIGIFEDDVCRPLVLSSAIILEGDYSKQQCKAVIDMIKRGGKCLEQWDAVIQKTHPNYHHDIPLATIIHIGKLSDGGGLTSDTCNSVRKIRRLLVECIKKSAVQMSEDPSIVHTM